MSTPPPITPASACPQTTPERSPARPPPQQTRPTTRPAALTTTAQAPPAPLTARSAAYCKIEAIAGQTGSTYAVQAADPGKSITCVVWAGNGAGVASAMSNAVAIPVPLALFAGVKVKGSVASVKLRCPGPGACSGTLKLVASMRHGKRTTNVTVGTASFSIAAGKSATIHVRLTAKGRSLMTKAGKRGLKVKLAGTGVKGRALVLKQATPAKHGKKKKK